MVRIVVNDRHVDGLCKLHILIVDDLNVWPLRMLNLLNGTRGCSEFRCHYLSVTLRFLKLMHPHVSLYYTLTSTLNNFAVYIISFDQALALCLW